MFLLMVLLAALGAVITGYYSMHYLWYGAAGAGILGLIVGIVAWNAGPNIVLGISQSRTATPLEQRVVHNVAEEVAIAAGIKMPEVYLIDDESPNAFATGKGPDKGIVCVTTGLLNKLDRDELQGVVAHEIAHIRNDDIRLMTTLAIVAGLIPMLSDFYLRTIFWGGGRRRSRDNDGGGILIIIGIVLAILAPLFSMLLQLAVSRKREFMADATGADFTRNPGALASALEKLTRDPARLESANRATGHLYIVNPLRKLGETTASLFSTHPSLEQRVMALRGTAGMPTQARLANDYSDMPDIPQQHKSTEEPEAPPRLN